MSPGRGEKTTQKPACPFIRKLSLSPAVCGPSDAGGKSSLRMSGAKRGVPNPRLFEEPEETRGLGSDEMRQQQQKSIQE